MKDLREKMEKVTRVEVIDYTLPLEEGGGRAYTRRDPRIKVELSLQDQERTLKVFITHREEKEGGGR